MLQIQATRDGSFTLFNTELNAHYHSLHGAYTEAMHVFIQNGLRKVFRDFPNDEIHVFEMGLGTAFNAILSIHETNEQNRHMNYEAVEAFPLPIELWNQYIHQHHTLFSNQLIQQWKQLVEVPWNSSTSMSPHVSFLKHATTFGNFNPTKKFHLIYWDAFAFSVFPDQWSEETIARLKQMLLKGACVVTYAAKGQIKRNFKKVGFSIETLPGPPGKREMIRLINTD